MFDIFFSALSYFLQLYCPFLTIVFKRFICIRSNNNIFIIAETIDYSSVQWFSRIFSYGESKIHHMHFWCWIFTLLTVFLQGLKAVRRRTQTQPLNGDRFNYNIFGSCIQYIFVTGVEKQKRQLRWACPWSFSSLWLFFFAAISPD